MPDDRIYSDYDSFAWFYNHYWAHEFSRPALGIFNVLLFPHLPAGGRVLDLCCGTGQLAAELCGRGYEVTGLDGSEAMLDFARTNAPTAEFIHADARSFALPPVFAGVISAFDSLNHVMSSDELTQVFRRVHAALAAGGVFLFDLNLEEEAERHGGSINIVRADHACIVHGTYDPVERLKLYEVTMFRRERGRWRRADVTLRQRSHDEKEVRAALARAGFTHVNTYDARREFGMTVSDGRMFYFARKA